MVQISRKYETITNFVKRRPVSKLNAALKSLLKQDLSEPELYGDLVYKFRKIVGRHDFSDQIPYKRTEYNMNVIWQTAWLVVNPVTVNNSAAIVICIPAGRASDRMKAPA